MNSQMLLGPNGLVYAIKEPDDYVRLYWGPLPFYSYKQNDPEGKKLGIALLASQGMTYQSIGELFGINRHTVSDIQTVYEKSGIEGLRNYHQGPDRIDEATCTFVIAEYARLNRARGLSEQDTRRHCRKSQGRDFPLRYFAKQDAEDNPGAQGSDEEEARRGKERNGAQNGDKSNRAHRV